MPYRFTRLNRITHRPRRDPIVAKPVRVTVVCLSLFVAVWPAWAWGPHSEITRAGMAVLPQREAAQQALGDEWPRLADYAWIPDWQSDIHYGVYADDFLLFPSAPRHVSHMVPEARAIFAPLFRRSLQALRTENSFNAARWIGSLLHYIEDSGSPPHAAGIGGSLHFKMENWLDAKRIQIVGYEPTLLGRTDDEAVRGFAVRMERLIEFSRERGLKLKPILEALKDREDQELILECAQEVSRTVADSLHTLFHLGLAPVELAGCSLSGRVRIGDSDTLSPTGARVMLAGSEFCTVTDLSGNYSFRNLPAGRVTILVQATGADVGRVEQVELRRDQPTQCDIALRPDAAGANVVRNSRFELTWYGHEIPDGWQRDEQNAKRWVSLPVPVPHGTTLRLTVDFADRPVPVSIRWRGNGRVVTSGSTQAIVSSDATDSSLSSVVSADASLKPAYGNSVFVEVLLETDKPLRDVCRHIALVPGPVEPVRK